MNRAVAQSSQSAGVALRTGWLITVSPAVIIGLYSFLLVLEPTRAIAKRMLLENQLVELLTFAIMLSSGILGIFLVWRSRLSVDNRAILMFYTLFSIGLLFAAMEEISWGQQFLGFATPEWLAGHNAQGELTLHNLNFFQKYLEAWPLIFGLGGCLGVWLGSFPGFRSIASPALLLSWFMSIVVFSAIDLYHEFHVFSKNLYLIINELDELVECMVAISCLLYLLLNRRFI